MSIPDIKKLKELKKKLVEAKEITIKSKDTHSAPSKENPKKEGVAASDKKWEAKQVDQGNGTKENPKKEGVAASDKKWEAKQVDQGNGTKAVNKEEGAKCGDTDWLSPDKFRSKIRAELGLPLTDPLNSVGKGLNKG